MKKIAIGIMVLSMIAIVSCKKKDATVNGGSWSFKSNTYTVTSSTANTADQSFVVINKGNNTYNQLLFTFGTLPSADGAYTIVPTYPDSTGTQVQLSMTLTTGAAYAGPTYAPDPAGNGTATVTVSNGIMKIVLPPTSMINNADTTDHANLTGTVIQTQK